MDVLLDTYIAALYNHRLYYEVLFTLKETTPVV